MTEKWLGQRCHDSNTIFQQTKKKEKKRALHCICFHLVHNCEELLNAINLHLHLLFPSLKMLMGLFYFTVNIRPSGATALMIGALHWHTPYIRLNKQRRENMTHLLDLEYNSNV